MVLDVSEEIKKLSDCFYKDDLINESTNNIENNRESYYSLLKQKFDYI